MILEQSIPSTFMFTCIFSVGPAARNHSNIFVLSTRRRERGTIRATFAKTEARMALSEHSVAMSVTAAPDSRNVLPVPGAASPLASERKLWYEEEREKQQQ